MDELTEEEKPSTRLMAELPIKLKHKGYYVDRILETQRAVKHEAFGDPSLAEYIAETEEAFEELLQRHSKNQSVHLLIRDESGVPIWQKSRGNATKLFKYLDEDKRQYFPPIRLKQLLEEATRQKIVIVSDSAGMGKSITLTYLGHNIKHQNPLRWVQLINLNLYTKPLKERKTIFKREDEVVDFFIHEISALSTAFEKAYFKKKLREGKMVLLLDGFDEVSPDYKDKVMSLIECLMKTPIEQIWITTRPHLKDELVKRFQQIPYVLVPFSREEQIDFTIKFWRKKFGVKKRNGGRLAKYAEVCIDSLAKSIIDENKSFTGFPLHTRMLAEAFETKAQEFHSSDDEVPALFRMDLTELYLQFFDKKFRIFHSDKNKAAGSHDKSNLAANELTGSMWDEITPMKYHENLALQLLFPDHKHCLLDETVVMSMKKKSYEHMTRFGLLLFANKKYQFIHRTYAEYLVAFFAIKQIGVGCKNSEVLDFVLCEILSKLQFRVIRYFINGLITLYSILDDEISPRFGKRIEELWQTKKEAIKGERSSILHNSVNEANVLIVKFLKECLQEDEYKDLCKEMLEEALEDEVYLYHEDDFSRDVDPQKINIWHLTALNGNAELMQFLQDWSEEVDIDYQEYLHLKGIRELTVLETVVKWGHEDLLELLRHWKGEIEILSYVSEHNVSIWQRALDNERSNIIKTFLQWTEENDFDFKSTLAEKFSLDRTMLHLAAEHCRENLFDDFLLYAQNNDMILSELLMDRDATGMTPWHYFASRKNASNESWQALLKWTNEAGLNLKDLLTDKNNKTDRITWFNCITRGNLDTFERLLNCTKELGVDTKELLMNEDRYGQTVWFDAVQCNNIPVFDHLILRATEESLDIKQILVHEDIIGDTVWHKAIVYGFHAMVLKLVELAEREQFDLRPVLQDVVVNISPTSANAKIISCIYTWLLSNVVNLKDLLNKKLTEISTGKEGGLPHVRACAMLEPFGL